MSNSFLAKLRQENSLTTSGLRLYYLLDRKDSQLRIDLVVARMDPGGQLESPQPYQMQSLQVHRGQAPSFLAPSFLDADDVSILNALREVQPLSPGSTDIYLTHEHLAPDWCEKLLATGRVLTASGHRPICKAPDVDLVVQWSTEHDGTQILRWTDDAHRNLIMPGSLHYWDEAKAAIGVFRHSLVCEAQAIVYQQPRLPFALVAEFLANKGSYFQSIGLPLPVAYETHFQKGEPCPQLRFGPGKASGSDVAELWFGYHYEQQSAWLTGEGNDALSLFCGDKVVLIERNKSQEENLWQQLQARLNTFSPRYGEGYGLGFGSRRQWQSVMVNCVPGLKRSGWSIEILPGFRFHFIEADTVKASVLPEAHSWFDLELQIDLDGEKLSLLPLLASATRRFQVDQLQAMPPDEKLDFQLKDGRILLISAKRVLLWFSVLVELEDLDDGPNARLKLPITQLARLRHLTDDEALVWEDSENLSGAHQLMSKTPPLNAFALPEERNACLRPYQMLGVAWLQQRRSLGFGGILADDMGLGKTLQTLSHIAVEKHQGRLHAPVLIVAPRSVMSNWLNEAARFVPHLSALIMHGSKRHEMWTSLSRYDLLITSYHSVLSDLQYWQRQSLSLMVLDEAQMIKNSQAKITRAIKQLSADSKIALTGTPMENHLGELWSLFDFVVPGLLGTEKSFNRHYRKPIEQHANEGRATVLMKTIAPFMLRRKKQEVAKELPEKTDIIVRLPLQKEQRDVYETLRVNAVKHLASEMQGKQESQGRVMILNALMQLRQVCCDPGLITGLIESEQFSAEVPSAKRERLLAMLEELIDEGRSILVFSQFTRMLDLIATDLTARHIDYLMLTGKSTGRDKLVKQFQSRERCVFLISLKAGGTGLNLTQADTVIHYDPWWNSSAEQQATDRAHRIGQDKPVFVYKLIAEDTIEEKIQNLQRQKTDLLDQVYHAAEGGSRQLALDNADLLALIE